MTTKQNRVATQQPTQTSIQNKAQMFSMLSANAPPYSHPPTGLLWCRETSYMWIPNKDPEKDAALPIASSTAQDAASSPNPAPNATSTTIEIDSTPIYATARTPNNLGKTVFHLFKTRKKNIQYRNSKTPSTVNAGYR